MLYIVTLEKSRKIPEPYGAMASNVLAEQIAGGTVPEFESLPEETIFNLCFSGNEETGGCAGHLTVSLRRERILFLCQNQQVSNWVREMTTPIPPPLENSPQDTDPLRILLRFLSAAIRQEAQSMEALEDRISAAEENLILNENDNTASKIMDFRKEIRRLKKTDEAMDRIVQGLYENDNDLIEPEMLRHYKLLNDKMDRALAGIRGLHEYVSQLREAYQAQIDIQQNSLMKVFTLVSTVFLPLTLLVGWYGMNLQMPEFGWRWGYSFVAAISMGILIASLIFFKKKKWL